MFNEAEREQVRLFGKLISVNPFLEERTDVERKLLLKKHIRIYDVWNCVNGKLSVNVNLAAINSLCDSLVEVGLAGFRENNLQMDECAQHEWDGLALYWLFAKYSAPMCQNIYLGDEAESGNAKLYGNFTDDYARVLLLQGRQVPPPLSVGDTFALFHQIHRAFNYIFDFIAGGTSAAAGFRAAIWQSIFTCDFSTYCRQLLHKMNEITTLVTGESGTGKELVARAIAFSQFIPFEPKTRRFGESYRSCFTPVQLSAMPQALVESELFGHARGAFTGAVEEHRGHFETCGPCGCIFLDEIGDVSAETQVKLLRLLQTRQFRRVGGNKLLPFKGKIIAATNSDLSEACADGRFRQDLLFRICSDTVSTVPLRQLVDGKEEELRQFVLILAKRMLEGKNADSFAERCGDWIVENLGVDYAWPGNVRELEQCLRNLLIRGRYTPITHSRQESWSVDAFFGECGWTADEVMKRYVAAVHKKEGSVLGTSKATGLDRRTVKKLLEGRKK